MAVTKIWKINGWIGDCLLYIENPNKTQNPLVIGDPKLKEEEYQSLTDVIEYAEDGNKTVRDTERFVSGVNCDAETARQEMILAKNAFDKNDGICAYHAIQSFAPGEVTPETAHEIGIRLAKEMWGERYQVLVATHLDHEHIHNHFVINSVSFLDGKRLWKEKNYWQMRTVSDALCREYGLSLIKPVRRGMPYAAWQAEKEGKPNRRKALREDIDRILANENKLAVLTDVTQAEIERDPSKAADVNELPEVVIGKDQVRVQDAVKEARGSAQDLLKPEPNPTKGQTERKSRLSSDGLKTFVTEQETEELWADVTASIDKDFAERIEEKRQHNFELYNQDDPLLGEKVVKTKRTVPVQDKPSVMKKLEAAKNVNTQKEARIAEAVRQMQAGGRTSNTDKVIQKTPKVKPQRLTRK